MLINIWINLFTEIGLLTKGLSIAIVLVLSLIPLIYLGSIRAQLLYMDEVVEVSISRGSANVNNTQFYAPPEAEVVAGSSVRWTNNDNVIHTVVQGKPTNTTASPEFDSGQIRPGGAFVHSFDEPGPVEYYDSIYPHMVGKIIVNSPGAFT